jgi:hypothetical protein
MLSLLPSTARKPAFCQVIELNNSQEVRTWLHPEDLVSRNRATAFYHSFSKEDVLQRLLKLSAREEHANI